jgi:hypothetical protein
MACRRSVRSTRRLLAHLGPQPTPNGAYEAGLMGWFEPPILLYMPVIHLGFRDHSEGVVSRVEEVER